MNPFVLLSALWACPAHHELPTLEIRVKDIPVLVEVADEPGERVRGLQHRETLPADEGMLFVYPEEQELHFWMEYTTIPLSIAFIDRKGRIVRLADMKPLDRTPVPSVFPSMYALEMNQGWFVAHDVGLGDLVTGLPGSR